MVSISESLRERIEHYARLLNVPNAKSIRLWNADLATVIARAAYHAETTFAQISANWPRPLIESFWVDNEVPANDWIGLVAVLLKKRIPNIFTPLEDVDPSLVLEIRTPSLGDLFDRLGTPSDLSDRVTVVLDSLSERPRYFAGPYYTDSCRTAMRRIGGSWIAGRPRPTERMESSGIVFRYGGS